MDDEREKWLRERRNGIGGSDAPVVLGLSPYAKPLDLYLDKIGEGTRDVDSDWLRWGRMLEPLILDEYERIEGCTLDRDLMEVHPSLPWMRASLDGRRQDNGAIVDAKSVGSMTADHWGEAGTDEVPVYIAAQMMHYMIVTGVTLAHVPALFLSERKVRVYHVHYDDDTAEAITTLERRFWADVCARKPPTYPLTNETAVQLYRRDNASTLTATEQVREWCAQLRDMKRAAKGMQDACAGLEGLIKHYMREAAVLDDEDGNALATWKTSRPERLDIAALRDAEPATFKRYAVRSDQRRFLLK